MVVADAAATLGKLAAEHAAAGDEYEQHDRRRRESGATARRAQAHRLRMQVRAAELRVEAAEGDAEQRRGELDDAARALGAWRLVETVLDARKTTSTLAGLEEQRDAAEKETRQLRDEERRHRHSLARLLTHRRDAAVNDLAATERRLAKAREELKKADTDLRSLVAAHATASEQARQLQSQVDESEQTIASAVAAGLLSEDADPALVDASLAKQLTTARTSRKASDAALNDLDEQTKQAGKALSAAQQRLSTARADTEQAERERRAVSQRVDALVTDERLLDVVGRTDVDPLVERSYLTDALRQRAANADNDAAVARATAAGAQRVIDSVGSDRLLPPSALVEMAVNRCQAAELPAWSGWRWLADTMSPAEAERFAGARPEIASGVVVAHPDLVEPVVEKLAGLDVDVALWVGAVTDPQRALNADESAGGTRSRILLPSPGVYDRDAARDLVVSARDALAEATCSGEGAVQRGANARSMLAALDQLWTDLPEDPRPELAAKAASARQRQVAAEGDTGQAQAQLDDLGRQREQRQRERETAQETIDTVTEQRLQLAPVVTAAEKRRQCVDQLPDLRETIFELQGRIDELTANLSELGDQVQEFTDQVISKRRTRDDAFEALRSAGLSATTDGPLPAEDDQSIRARLASIEAALKKVAVDPALHDEIDRIRRHLSDLTAQLDTDPQRRALAEQFANSDGARHPVALAASLDAASAREAQARGAHAKAEAAAEQARTEHQQRAGDLADRSSPDVDGFPAATAITNPSDADRLARQLDDIAAQQLETQRREEQLARQAETAAGHADRSSKLIETLTRPLRHLSDPSLTGRPTGDVDLLTERINDAVERERRTTDALAASEAAQRRAADAIRAHANSPEARRVEDRDDPRVVDLILRLRGDERLPAEAEHIAGHLEQRAAALQDDLDNHEHHVRTCAKILQTQASTAVYRLRAYQNQSSLPKGLGDWSDRKFVIIDHDPVPTDESVAIDRVARVVHAQLAPDASRSDAQAMLFAAAKALVEAPFRVKLLKPHTDLALDRVDVAELKNFSGGQRVTAGVLLYATMTRVRAAGDAASVGWLWLDNPFGQASADQFVRTMRLAADKLGLQLVFTAAPKDKGALSMFDRIIALARRHRPSSGERVVVIDDGTQEVADLTLMQREVLAVLGE